MQDKPARFTILIDADRKKAFEALCESRHVTSSHMVRQLIGEYLERHGVDCEPGPGAGRKRARPPR